MVFFVLADAGFRFLRSHLFLFVSVRLGNIMGNEIFRRLLFLPPAFTETANIGSQVARFRDFDSIREFFAGQSLIAAFELPFMLILLAALTIIGGKVALVPIAAILIFAVFGLAIWPTVRRTNEARDKSGSEKQTLLLELLANMRALRLSGAGSIWHKRYRSISVTAAVDQDKLARVTAFINAFSHGLVMAGGLATLAFGVNEVLNKQMSMGALVACVMLVWRILAPIGTGFGVLTQVGRVNKSVNQVNRLMNMPLEARQEAAVTAEKRLQGQIELSDVSIRYSTEAPPALLGINMVIEKGKTLVVVGHDGAGKSTLLKLIMGLYTPQAGRVLIDSINVRQMDPVALRHSIAYVPKSDYLLHGTIFQNLQFSNYVATEEQVRLAAQKVGLLEDIEALPDGFQSRIKNTNMGQFSSSFQKRISLARAFLRQSQILLLDEPESGLSGEESANLLVTLTEMKEENTIIIVTHDPGFFWVADKVLWLEKGRIKMWGSTADVAPKYLK